LNEVRTGRLATEVRQWLVLKARAEAMVPMPHLAGDGGSGASVGPLIRDDDTAGMPSYMFPPGSKG